MPRPMATDFYPSDATELAKRIDELLGAARAAGAAGKTAAAADKKKIFGALVPHGGHECAGPTSAAVFSRLALAPDFDSVIIIGPNHADVGEPIAAAAEDFETPLGTIRVDTTLGRAIAKNLSIVKEDDLAHEYEHSIEAALPFLQKVAPLAKILPLLIAPRLASLENCELLGDAISRAIGDRRVLVLASSNLAHTPAAATAAVGTSDAEKENQQRIAAVRKSNDEILSAVVSGDAKKVFEIGRAAGVCGHAAIATLLFVLAGRAKKTGKSDIVAHTTNLEAGCTKHREKIVGYAGVVFE